MKKAQRLSTLAAVAFMALGLVMALAPTVHAANPSISQTSGSSGSGVTALTATFGTVGAGDTIVVFEYFGAQTYPPACQSILKPTDSLGNTYRPLGCTLDSTGGAQAAYFVQASGTGSSDTITCNYGSSIGTVESCYAFDVSSPAGAATVLTSGTGLNDQVPVLVSAQSNSVLLATVGYTYVCHSATFTGQVPSGLSPLAYSPSNECGTYGSDQFGLTGTYVVTGQAGTYQWTMDPATTGGGGGVTAAWSLIVVQVPGPSALVTSTSYSSTVVGWLVPDSAHFSNSLLLMTIPLAGLVFGMMFAWIFSLRGDLGVYFALGGLTLGSLLTDLPVNSSSTALGIPFAYTIVSGLLTFLYWWNS